MLRLFLPLVFSFTLAVSSAAIAAAAPADGRSIYERNCAVCHGPRGKPDPANPLLQEFERLPADLSDPLFSSREPLSDWLIVATHGGPALGFSERMPAFAESLTPEEIRAAVLYAKTLAGAQAYPPGDLNLFLALRTKKAFPEDEVVWKLRQTTRDGADAWQNRLEIEKRFGKRWQISAELVHGLSDGHGNLEEIEPGIKYVAWFDPDQAAILSLGLAAAVAAGDNEAPWKAVPFAAFGKVLGGAFTVQASIKADLPSEDLDRDGALEMAGVVHFVPPGSWPRGVFPGLELTASVPFESAGRDAVQFTLAPQLRLGLSKRGHVALNLGVEVPLNETDRYDFRGYAWLIWDFADGWFYEGW